MHGHFRHTALFLIVCMRSFSKMLSYVKFAEDKVLVFVILCEKFENSAIRKSNPNPNPDFHNRLIR